MLSSRPVITSDAARSLLVMDDSVLPMGFAVVLDSERMEFAPDDVGYYRIRYMGQAVGYIERHFEFLNGQASRMHLHQMRIKDPNLRKLGFGSACMRETIERSRWAGIRELTLEAIEDGRWIWRRFGFEALALTAVQREQAACEANAVMQAAGVHASCVRWRRLLEQPGVTMHDIHDYRPDGLAELASLAQHESMASRLGPSSQAAVLSWQGLLKI